jgi:hypothetical protein
MKGLIALPIVLIVMGAVFLHYSLKYQCNQYEELTGRTTRLSPLDACYVADEDGVFYRWDEWMMREATANVEDGDG